MRITCGLIAFTLLTFSLHSPVMAVTDAQFQRIARLGELNGVALHCRYQGESSRIKQALIERLPKRRELGLAFDQMTSESFLAFIKAGRSCPEAAVFSHRVDEAIQALDQAF